MTALWKFVPVTSHNLLMAMSRKSVIFKTVFCQAVFFKLYFFKLYFFSNCIFQTVWPAMICWWRCKGGGPPGREYRQQVQTLISEVEEVLSLDKSMMSQWISAKPPINDNKEVQRKTGRKYRLSLVNRIVYPIHPKFELVRTTTLSISKEFQ